MLEHAIVDGQIGKLAVEIRGDLTLRCGEPGQRREQGRLIALQQSEKAVESITFNCFCNASRYVILSNRFALGFFFGSLS